MILCLLLIVSFSFSDYHGGYPGAGIRYSTNAREMALGNAIIAEYNQGFNAFSNPALISKTKGYEWGATYFSMSLDRYVQVLSISRNLAKSAGASFSIFRSGVKNLIGKDENNQSTGSFESSESYIMLSFADRFGKSFFYGTNIKAIFNNIDTYKATGIAIDIGLLYNLSKLSFSCIVNNIHGEYLWDHSSQKEPLPILSAFGLKYVWNKNIKLFSRLDYMKPDKINYYRFRSGIEFIKSNYRIRLGLIQDAGETISGKKIAIENGLKNFNFLGGFGININEYLKLDFCIDLGKQDEGVSHLISISFKK